MVATAHQPNVVSPASDAASRLRSLAAVATQLELTALSTEAKAFADRVAEGLFYVACVGQFKRGKSSLLNALAAGAQLPTGVVPVTSVVTIVRYGRERHGDIYFRSGDPKRISLDELPSYVTESANPHNAKGVTVAEVFVPSGLLASGMCLVDTPGIGSVSIENTAATEAFVPHIDAALVVLGSDPPISADELTLVDAVARQTAELIFVLNKADRSTAVERQEARTFCEAVLATRLGRPIGPMLEVSATQQLAGGGPARDWPRLVSQLTNLAERAGSHLVHAAAERGAQVLGARALHEIGEREAALTRPLAESEKRIEALKHAAVLAERSLGDLSYLLTAEENRLHGVFAERQELFRVRVVPAARAELAGTMRTLAVHSRSERWREAHRVAQDIYRRLLEAWRAEEQPDAEAVYRAATQRFVDLANDFLTRVATQGALLPAELRKRPTGHTPSTA
ncbi:MAG: dynamin family protein [Candidatus Binatia bacterium]